MNSLAKYGAIFGAQVTNSLAYPLDLLARSASIIVFMLVFISLWGATFRSVGEATIGGLTLVQTLWYLMLAETIILSKPRLSTVIAQAVKDGSIAYLLNKPYDLVLYQFSVGLGDSIVRLGLNALLGGAIVWLAAGPPPDPRGWPLVLVAVALAWIIDFIFSTMIGLLAFLTEEIAAFEWIYAKILFLLGGLLIPLDFFPEWLRSIAGALPFAYSVYGPARLFVEPSLERFGTLLVGQLLWIAGLGLALAFFYRRGLAWLTINGG